MSEKNPTDHQEEKQDIFSNKFFELQDNERQ